MKEINWIPVRRGDIYCSSACGGNCTRSAYETACRDAKALARRMGPKWKTEINENLGWYWHVVRDGATLSPSAKGYHLSIHLQGWAYHATGTNPLALYAQAKRELSKHITSLHLDRQRM